MHTHTHTRIFMHLEQVTRTPQVAKVLLTAGKKIDFDFAEQQQ